MEKECGSNGRVVSMTAEWFQNKMSNKAKWLSKNRRNEMAMQLLQERIDLLEKNLSEIHKQLALYTRKIGRIRDGGDCLADSIFVFAENENINRSLRSALVRFADNLVSIQDLRDAQVQQLENQILEDVALYSEYCKKAKEETRKHLNNRTKSESNENVSSLQSFDKQIDRFEHKKIIDIKNWFLTFAEIEMYFHAKSIEFWTNSFQNVLQINEELDLIEFRNKFGIKINDATKTNDTLLATLRRFSSSPSVFSPEKKAKAEETAKTDVYDSGTSTEADSDGEDKLEINNSKKTSSSTSDAASKTNPE